MSKYLREPLVQFLLISALIYGAYAVWGIADDEGAQREIYIRETQVAALANSWEKRWNRPPTEVELIGLLRGWLREEVFYREALSMGLDQDDHIIRRRLAQKLDRLWFRQRRSRNPNTLGVRAIDFRAIGPCDPFDDLDDYNEARMRGETKY